MEKRIQIIVAQHPDGSVVGEGDTYMEMKEELEKRYGCRVDLVEKEALRNPWRKREIMRTREMIDSV